MPKGRVKWYKTDVGLGFITPDAGGDDVLFRRAAVVGNDSSLTTGTPVDYDAMQGTEGPVATRVTTAAA